MSGYIGTQPVPQATQTRDSFTATSGQTSFATGGYTPNFLDVYLNGVKLASADYTATNGSDVVLASGAATGDILEVVAFTTFTPANIPSGTPSIDDNGNATALTIDSSENVNIGGSPASDKLSVNGTVSVNDSTYSVYSSGVSSNIGSVGNTANDLNIFSTTTGHNGLRFHSTGILPTDNTGAIVDNDCNIGHSSFRFKDAYLSGNVYVGTSGFLSNNAGEHIKLDNVGDTIEFSTAATERMRITSSGRVGLGTSSPSVRLENSDSGNNTTKTTATNSNTRAGFLCSAKTPAGVEVQTWIRSEGDGSAGVIFTQSNHKLGFATNNAAPQMILDTSGNVGIIQDLNIGNNDSSNPLSKLRFGATQHGAADIRPSDEGGHKVGLDFYTDGTGDATINPTFAMRIDSTGAVFIGKTGEIGTQDGFQFKPTGECIVARGSNDTMFVFQDSNSGGAQVGSISMTSSSTAYNTSSDYRLKTDAQPMTGASERVQALKPVNFEWISDGTRVDGFLAHEAQAVVPESVTGTKDAMRDEEYEVTPAVEATYDEDGNELTAAVEAVMGTRSVPDYQGIDQSKLVPLLTAALQEALAKIDAMETRLTALEG